jgi:hypothetical protein
VNMCVASFSLPLSPTPLHSVVPDGLTDRMLATSTS